MALFKQFSGSVYDELSNLVTNFRFRGYHRQKNIWSDWYYSGIESQYNINLGDASFLTQNGTVSIGDNILLIVETLDTVVTDRKFSMLETTITAEDTRVINIQIKSISYPKVQSLWYLSSTSELSNKILIDNKQVYLARVNDTVTAIENFTDEQSWTFQNNIMYQVSYRYNQNIFNDRLGIDNIKYNWYYDNLYISNNSNIYTNITDNIETYIPIKTLVTNKKGLFTEDTLYLRVLYRKPIPNIEWSPENPNVTSEFIISNETIDIDNTITNIDYFFNGLFITGNTDINHNWQQILNSSFSNILEIKLDIDYNDGFNNLNLIHVEYVEMTNIPLDFNISQEEIVVDGTQYYKINIVNINDPDGNNNLANFKWLIEYKTPIDLEYKIIYQDEYKEAIDQNSRTWLLNVPGEYRVTIIGKDEFGLETSKNLVIIVSNEDTCTSDIDSIRYIEWE